MKAFFLRHRNLHIWLLADVFFLAAFWIARNSRACMNALASVTTPLKRAIGRVCYLVDFSVAEALCVLLILGGSTYLVWSIAAVIAARGRRRRRAYRAFLRALCMGLTIYAGLCLLWGVNYYTDSFQTQSGIVAQPVAKEDLAAVMEYFAEKVSETADSVARDGTGLFAVSREEILASSAQVYRVLEQQFPFLAFDDPGVKPVRFSRIMSLLGFTGVYCPFTGESNVNVDSPACLLPSTAAHELAHQRSISSEQECNFLSILSCTTSGNAAYAYSGWLLGYIHLGNALYSKDPDAYYAIWDTLPDTVKRDLRDNNVYWEQFQDTTAQKVSNQIYDGFLKGYGESDGLQSYGTVVDLLVVYYESDAAVR